MNLYTTIDLPPGDKLTRAALEVAFHIHWSGQTKIQKTTEQKKAELFTQVLNEEKMLEKGEIGGSWVYGYIVWAD